MGISGDDTNTYLCLEALAKACSTSSSDASLESMLRSIDQFIGGDVAYYRIDHAAPGLSCVLSSRRGSAPRRIGIRPLSNLRTLTESELQQHADLDDYVVIPIRTNYGIVGAIAFSSTSELDLLGRPLLDLLLSGFVPIAEQQFLTEFLIGMQQPVNYRRDREDFFQDLLALVQLATPMEYVAIRLVEDGLLKCVAVGGFSTAKKSLEEFDLNLVDVPIFAATIRSGRAQQCESLSEAPEELVGTLKHMPRLSEVESFVVAPITAGAEVTGVLSLASRLRATYSPTEIIAFMTLANGIGVSISNYLHFHQAVGELNALAEVAVKITAIEVAQSARHEAKALIANIVSDLAALDRLVSNRDTVEARKVIQRARETGGKVNNALEKIKTGTKPPVQELGATSVLKVWGEAKSQVFARLANLNIKADYEGSDETIEAYPDWLRHAFLNLLLNSADAFESRGRKGNRRIVLRMRAEVTSDSTVYLRYSDNAGGILESEFASVPNPRELAVEQLIFEPDVTSKKDGSGWGLFLVREILRRHDGGIEVVSLRRGGGVTFDLELPRKQIVE